MAGKMFAVIGNFLHQHELREKLSYYFAMELVQIASYLNFYGFFH